MADKKISALTSATTPLTGTEVLPIVQSGATVKVAVSDLTAGRAVSATTVNKVTITAPASASTLTIADGKTLTASNSLTLAGTDATTQTFPATNATIARTDAAQTFTGTQTFTAIGLTGYATGAKIYLSSNISDSSYIGQTAAYAGYDTIYFAGRTGSGNVGSHTFMTSDSGGTDTIRFQVANSGISQFTAYGAGAATFSASGVISSVSDETWKIKDGVPSDPDSMLQQLEPGYWFYNEEKQLIFGTDRQLGFYAQNVNAAIGPEAAPIPEEYEEKGVTKSKPWGYYDRSVLAITVMSLKKALETIKVLTDRIALLEKTTV